MNIGFIGSGKMAFEHALVFKHLGCKIYGVANPRDSKNLKLFLAEFQIENFYFSGTELISNPEIDAIIVCTPPLMSIEYSRQLQEFRKFALIEKPGAVSSKSLKLLNLNDSKNLRVAYNRRSYKSVQTLKEITSKQQGSYIFDLILPNFKDKSDMDFEILNNSVHFIDLINFLIPDVRFMNFRKLANGLLIDTANTAGKVLGTLRILVGGFRNQSVSWDSECVSATLKPIETLKIANEYSILEPGEFNRQRSFTPIWKNENLEKKISDESHFKPGFLLQAQEFIKVCNNETSVILATTEDAFKALKTAELIIKKMNALNL